jgi:hypothetical protein
VPLTSITIQGTQNRFNSTWTQIGLPGNLKPGIVTLNGFSFDKSLGQIDGYNASFGTNVVIPSSIDGVAVTSIGYQAFRNKGLTSVTIPNTVTTIREYAFSNNNLTNLSIPNSVTSLGNFAFYINNIVTLSIGSGLNTIPVYAFYNNLISNLVIPNQITSIGGYAFENNPISQLTLGSGLTRIDSGAFQTSTTNSSYSSKLTSLIIPSNVTTINSNAFTNVPLTSITIQGTQNRFNSTWTQIGLPGNLKPQQ